MAATARRVRPALVLCLVSALFATVVPMANLADHRPDRLIALLTLPMAGAVAVVAVRLLRDLRGADGEAGVWRFQLTGVLVILAGVFGSLVPVGLLGATPSVLRAGVLVFGASTLVAAHFVYQGICRWSKIHTTGFNADDWLNGLSAVLVLMAIIDLALPDGRRAETLIDQLQHQAAVGGFSVAIILVLSLLTVANLADLFGDARMWLLLTGLLLMFGPISACLFGPAGTHVPAASTALLAVSLMVLAAARPIRVHRTQQAARNTPTDAALGVVALAVGLLVLAGFGSGGHRLTTAYAALAVIGSSSRMFRTVRDLEQLQTTRTQAMTDELTGIANRRALLADLERVVGRGTPASLMIIDLDDFKLINDRFGHSVGDELLRQVTQIFRAALPKQARLARLGGDEFAVLLPGSSGERALEVGRRLVVASAPYRDFEGRPLRVRASVGIAASDGARLDPTELMRRADTAMYRAKSSGEGVARFDESVDALAQEQLQLLEDLREVLDLDSPLLEQMQVYFQPQVELGSGAVVGAEALVRWLHPRHGLIPPDRFLDLVERNGLMGALTTRVVHESARRWYALREAGLSLRISVNLSTSCLAQPGLLNLLDDVVAQGVDPASFVLEITETSVMADPELAIATMRAMRARGFAISIDDYGTGYSSLSYLNDLPACELKLDKSFVARLLADDRTTAIVAGTVELAHRLGMRLVAEGVEDVATLAILRDLGCDESQGYLHARPMPAADFESWLSAGSGTTVLAHAS
ncbi:putative bifunctional diguanylate cyclase/phosphodiesterase [Spongisporangium articulatum]|uniref:Bifunctional diguanylate cyclase/phosphodiesterase n=1 Tax=Spongisporangium articulatum TaxID=3362603 RepID=A0ABW8AQX3_9ACTN